MPRGCFGPSNPGVRTKGSEHATRLRSFAAAANVALALAAVPPENVPFMSRTRPLTRLTGAPSASSPLPARRTRRVRTEPNRSRRRTRCARPRFGSRLMRIDHLAHPDRLAAEIEIVGSRDAHRPRPDRSHRADKGRPWNNDLVWSTIAFSEAGSPASATISGVSSGAPIASRTASELVQAAAGHRPFQVAVAIVLCSEVFGDELAGETGGAVHNDVEFRRRHSF